MPYSIQHISKIVSGKLLGTSFTSTPVEYLALDSRKIIFPAKSLFFAIVGKRHNGHHFLEQAYAQGLGYFVVSEPVELEDFPEAQFIQVPDTLRALQQLAQFHRTQFNLQTIGITGSNGKTIVKEWLFQLLREDFQIVRSPKSYNSQIGVPLSVWEINSKHDLGIFEAGISERHEMQYLAPIINCQIGIFTNIGTAHAAGFSTQNEKIREKLQLFENAELLIYRKDNPSLHNEIQQANIPSLSWSYNTDADLQILKVDHIDPFACKIVGYFKKRQYEIIIPFKDDASIENAIHCWLILLHLHIDPIKIRKRMRNLEAVGMRLELREGIDNSTLINDSYNSDLNSLKIALDFLEQQGQPNDPKSLILSDILQSGQEAQDLYQEVAKLLQAKGIQNLYAIGNAIESIRPFLNEQIQFYYFPDTTSFIQQLPSLSFKSNIILLKGARQFQFERIADLLSQKVHQTTLEINLSALAHNLNIFHSQLKPETKMMIMVKAAAYGSGSVEIARLLEFSQVDYLAVAYADEGVELRRKGIQLPILVLNPELAVFDTLIRYRLEPEIYTIRLLEQFALAISNKNKPFPIHIKLDTGMHRLGFEEQDLSELVQMIKKYPQLRVASIFSHLAASEASEHDAFTHSQFQRYTKSYDYISSQIGYRPIRHILNSSGITRFPSYQLDMVRLGIGMYGIDPILGEQLRPVLQLKARISQIKTIAPNETVGYGRMGRIEQKTRIGTVSIGYADGLPRAAGNRRHHLFVRDSQVAIIGNVCMDMCMVDLNEVSDAQEGDEVVIFSSIQQLENLSKALQTIPYELLTNIAPRVKRIYIQE